MKKLSFLLIILSMLSITCLAFAEDLPKTIVSKDGATMSLIPEGKFYMGTSDADIKANAPSKRVHLNDYYIDIYEVTNERFAKFLNSSKVSTEERPSWVVIRSDLDLEGKESWWPTEIVYEDGKYTAFPGYETHPVQSVSWFAADAYCKWADKRLPTEAEWEKAARGNLSKKSYPWGDQIPTGDVIFNKAWKDNRIPPPTEPVGNYYPNGYGLYDMAGNVWEWCSDWYQPNYYEQGPSDNPKGPVAGVFKVLRGGSWFNSPDILRVAYRNFSNPYKTDDAVGFRCAMDSNNAIVLGNKNNEK